MIKLERIFTKEGQDVYSSCLWKKVDCIIKDGDKVIFEMKGAEFPEFYSQNACDIVASKYFRRAGVPVNRKNNNYEPYVAIGTETRGENSLKDCISRMVGHWTYWAHKMGIFEDVNVFKDEMTYILLHQYWSPNSPQWFNAGLNWAYGIKPAAHENYYTINGKYESGCYEQMHACFLQPIEDSMFGKDSIFELLNNEARIFKKGSGSGTNFSNLRGKGERLSGGGKSSGVISYLKIFDECAGSIKSGGVTRRSASMRVLDLDHPDVIDFIEWKSKEETKVASMITGSKINKHYLNAIVKDPENSKLKALALQRGIESNYIDRACLLAKMGYSEFPLDVINNDFNGEGYQTVSGQNSNNTVSITDKFFECLKNDLPWFLISRLPSTNQKNDLSFKAHHPQGIIYDNGDRINIDGTYYDITKTVQAKYLMDKIALNAWQSADPGVHFRDTINQWNTCLNDGEITTSNPCSEVFLLDNTACNLGSHKVTKYFENGKFNIELFEKVVYLSHIVLDITNESALLPSEGIAKGTKRYRPTGNGLMDVGALLMKMGIPYDSDKGRAWIGALTSVMTATCYIASADLADDIGGYEAFESNFNHHRKVVNLHRAASGVIDKFGNTKMLQLDDKLIPSDIFATICSLWSQCDIRNSFRNSHVTCLAPTGTISIQCDADTSGIEPDFSLIKFKKMSGGGYLKIVNQAISESLTSLGYNPKDIIEHIEKTGSIKGSKIKKEHESIFHCANDISWQGHVLAVAAAQPMLSGGISKTINMPHDATVDDIKEAYLFSYQHGLKCNAVYRDGSKLSQPLNITLDEGVSTEMLSIDYELNPKTIFNVPSNGRGIRVKPPARRAGWTDDFVLNGYKYYLRHNVDNNGNLIELWIDAPNESSSVRTALNTMCRFLSKALQYGMPVDEIVDTFVGIQQDPKGLVVHENVKVCKSIYDAVGKFIAYRYLGQKDMVDVNTEKEEVLIASEVKSPIKLSIIPKKTIEECPRCSSHKISKVSSCSSKCAICGYSWGGCGE